MNGQGAVHKLELDLPRVWVRDVDAIAVRNMRSQAALLHLLPISMRDREPGDTVQDHAAWYGCDVLAAPTLAAAWSPAPAWTRSWRAVRPLQSGPHPRQPGRGARLPWRGLPALISF